MAQAKKDGQHINYYIERSIYDRLKKYASEKGQPMATAMERILQDYLDRIEDEKQCSEQLGGI